MLDTKLILDKNLFLNGENKKKALIKLIGVKNNLVIEKKITKNIALAIDVSSSMNSYINGNINNFNFINNHNFENILGSNLNINKTKIQAAKEAAVTIVNALNEGDIISIITFSSKASVIIPSTQITSTNKLSLINTINSIFASGNTNLHDGWLESVKQVANKIDNSKQILNRVILLTDGQTNSGVCDIETFAKDVSAISTKNITTSTIGFGADFNEDFLLSLSKSGLGNSYYAKNNDSLINIVKYELNGISNICAKNIKIKLFINGVENFKIENLNNLMIDNFVNLTNIFADQEINLVYDLTFNSQNVNELNVSYEITYQNSDDSINTISSSIIINLSDKESYDKIDADKEVKVQDVLIVIANEKEKTKNMIDGGNYNAAFSNIGASINCANAFAGDARIDAELMNLANASKMVTTGEYKSLRKDLSYQSYSTRSGIKNGE